MNLLLFQHSLFIVKCVITKHFLLCVASAEEDNVSSDKEEGGEIQLEMVELTLGTLDLRESEICPSRHRRRRRKKKEATEMQNDGRSSTVSSHRWL